MQTVNICAPEFDVYSGYGRMACSLLEHLFSKGVKTNAIWRNSGALPTHSEAMQALIKQPIVPVAGGICMGYPTIIPRYGNLITAGPRIAVTMFESDKLPEGWVGQLKQCEAVIVPTGSQAQIFKSNGVNVPIHVVPLGVGEGFHYQTRPPLDDRPYTFVTWGDRGIRKGWHHAVQAFIGAFGNREDVQLIIKCRPDALEKLNGFSNNNIHLWKVDFDEPQLQDFYANADCMIFPSSGEGFGLPPREFAATGGLAIATEWWADDIQEWGIPLGYSLTPAWLGHPKFAGLGRWAEPHHLQLMSMMGGMVTIAKERFGLVQDMGKQMSAYVKEHYQWSKFAADVVKVWNDVLSNPRPRPVEVIHQPNTIVAGESLTRTNAPVTGPVKSVTLKTKTPLPNPPRKQGGNNGSVEPMYQTEKALETV